MLWRCPCRQDGHPFRHARRKESLRELIFTQQKLDKGPSVVVIGGGTGLSVLLRGIKLITNNCTAVVTTADDGGSSGRLRKEMGIIPPGDMRNCLVALADTEPVMERAMQYRFMTVNFFLVTAWATFYCRHE